MKAWMLWEARRCAFSLQNYWMTGSNDVSVSSQDPSWPNGDGCAHVGKHVLERLGIETKCIQNPGKYVDASGSVNIPPNTELGTFCNQRKFLQQDCVSLNAETTPDFEAKKAIFFEEHLHEDAEVRVIVQGVGFFDVRDDFDRWVRIRVETGDLLVLPAGIYHRFAIDEQAGPLQAIRVFSTNPKWVPVSRPCDDNPVRIAYRQRLCLLRSLNQ